MANPQAEPSMDEILASIRRIIAEEDEPVAEAAAEVHTPEPAEVTDIDETLDVQEEFSETFDSEPEPDLSAVGAEDAVDMINTETTEDEPELEVAPTVESVSEVLDNFDVQIDTSEAASDVSDEEVENSIEAIEIVAEQEESEEVVVEQNPVVEALEVEVQSAFENVSVSQSGSGLLNDVTVAATTSAFEALQENVKMSESGGKTLEDVVERLLEPLLRQWLDQNLTRIVEEKIEEEVRRIARRR